MEFSPFKPPFIEDFHLPCLIILEVCHSLNACQSSKCSFQKRYIIIKGANGIQRGVYFTAATVTENPMNLVFFASRLLQHPVTLHLGFPYLVLSKNMKYREKNSSNMWTTIINYKLPFFTFFLPKIFKQNHLISMHENGSEITAQCSAAREFGSVARENCCWAVKIPPAVRAIGKSA